MKIDKQEMASGYIEMGKINLKIANECFLAEHEANINCENNLKKKDDVK